MKLRLTIDVDDHDLQTLLAHFPRLLNADGVSSTQTDEIPALLTVAETAEALRISRGQVYEMTRTGKIRSIKIGRKLMVPRNAIGWFIDEQLQSTAATPDVPTKVQAVPPAETVTGKAKASRRRSGGAIPTQARESIAPRRSRQRVSTDPVTMAEFADTFEVPAEEAERIFLAGKFEIEDADGTLLAQRRHVVDWMKTEDFDAWGEQWIGKAPRRHAP